VGNLRKEKEEKNSLAWLDCNFRRRMDALTGPA